jgi:hypothetical protein
VASWQAAKQLGKAWKNKNSNHSDFVCHPKRMFIMLNAMLITQSTIVVILSAAKDPPLHAAFSLSPLSTPFVILSTLLSS